LADRWDVDEHQRTLQKIENQVLEEVSITRAWRAIGTALAIALAVLASAWWLGVAGQVSPQPPNLVPTVAVVALGGASAVSTLALRLRRYRWCCAAAYCCGLAAVIGIGAFWWVRTGQTGIGLLWLVFGDLVTVTLTLGWLAVIVTPIERSQPDMREHLVHRGTRRTK